MTDRELLELAAKATGLRIKRREDHAFVVWNEHDEPWYWNPLTDDGDALRLAVRLDILSDPDLAAELRDAAYADEPYASTRRIIVRAAAEIGKTIDD